jgi:hypothetical protein
VVICVVKLAGPGRFESDVEVKLNQPSPKSISIAIGSVISMPPRLAMIVGVVSISKF